MTFWKHEHSTYYYYGANIIGNCLSIEICAPSRSAFQTHLIASSSDRRRDIENQLR